jgi:hypothetical protein
MAAIKPTTVVTLDQQQIAAIQEGVRRSLKDPESARFGQIIGGRDEKGILHACGWVNAKNSYGGYTGEKPFVGILGEQDAGKKRMMGFAVAGMGGDDTADLVAHQMCQKLGLPLG